MYQFNRCVCGNRLCVSAMWTWVWPPEPKVEVMTRSQGSLISWGASLLAADILLFINLPVACHHSVLLRDLELLSGVNLCFQTQIVLLRLHPPYDKELREVEAPPEAGVCVCVCVCVWRLS
jgi:hypothetical protein